MDKLLPYQSYTNLSASHDEDTRPGMAVRPWLWGHGFRYRLNHPLLPGKPDIVMRKYRTCIFVNGCFWHGHHIAMPQIDNGQLSIDNSDCCKIPKTNREFWVAKIRRNLERDVEVQHRLTRWVGTPSPFGNVNWSRRCGKRLWNHWRLLSIGFSFKTIVSRSMRYQRKNLWWRQKI